MPPWNRRPPEESLIWPKLALPHTVAKVSRQAYNTFSENLAVARGFVKLQFYLEDLVTTGGKASVGVPQSWANELTAAVGLGRGGLEAFVKGRVGPELEERLKAADQKATEARVKRWVDRNKERFERLASTVREVGLAYQRGLPLQAIVIAASSFEAYVEDVAVEAIALNAYIEQRFLRDAEERLRYSDLRASGFDAHLAIGHAAIRAYDLSDGNRLKSLLERLLASRIEGLEHGGVKEYERLVAYRNLAAHRAGVADDRFKKATGYQGAIGTPVELRPKFVEKGLAFFEQIAERVQRGLEVERAR
jgi:hypothetical protein